MNKALLAALSCALSFTTLADTRPCEGAPGAFYTNPDQSRGGFVASSASVEALATLAPETQVCEYASLRGAVKLIDRAVISGRASLRGNIAVSGGAKVFGDANLINSDVGGDLLVLDDAKVYGSAYLNGAVMIADTSEVFGNARIHDFVQILGASRVCGQVFLEADTVLTDSTTYCSSKK